MEKCAEMLFGYSPDMKERLIRKIKITRNELLRKGYYTPNMAKSFHQMIRTACRAERAIYAKTKEIIEPLKKRIES